MSAEKILQFISERFPFFKRGELFWENGMRNMLSITEVFRKVDKEPGVAKCSEWCISEFSLDFIEMN